MAVVDDLSRDESFKGVVICALTIWTLSSEMWNAQEKYVTYFRRLTGWSAGPNALFSSLRQNLFVHASPQLSLNKLFANLARNKGIPEPLFITNGPDRQGRYNFDLCPTLSELREELIDGVRKGVEDTSKIREEWDAQLGRLGAMVRRFKERGADIVFVRFPTAGEHWRLTEAALPKSEFWDSISRRTGALTIHFRDYDQLARFPCPDSSHLDSKDSPAFTAALVDILREEGALP